MKVDMQVSPSNIDYALGTFLPEYYTTFFMLCQAFFEIFLTVFPFLFISLLFSSFLLFLNYHPNFLFYLPL